MSSARHLLLLSFWLAVILALLGSFVTFVPGSEAGWYLLVAGLSTSGLFVSSRAYRVSAALLLVLALTVAVMGHHRGQEYKQKAVAERMAP